MSSARDVRISRIPSLTWDDSRLLIESVVDYAIFMLDVDGRVATWNAGAEKIKGYSADEIVGEHFSKFFPPEDVAAGRPERELEVAREQGRTEAEGWRVRKDGTRFWANAVITALRDESRRLRGYAKVTRDLTDRKAAEEGLRRAEEKFHHLVDAVTDYAIFMLDAQGRVETWNAGARRTKGYEAEEIIGQHVSRFYTEEDRAAGKPAKILDAVRQHGRFEDEGWRVRKDGTRFWANVVITALRNERGEVTGFAKVTRDLTQRREAQETERKLLEEKIARAAAESAEQRLRVSEEKYRALGERLEVILEGVQDGITVHDRTGALVFANRAAATSFGFPSVDAFLAVGQPELDRRFALCADDGDEVEPDALPARRIMRGEPPLPMTLRIRDKTSGREWWSLVRAGSVLDADGKTDLAITIWHDVTAERRRDLDTVLLGNATAALASSLEQEVMLPALARSLVPGLADWCSVYLHEDGRLRNAAIAHIDTPHFAEAERYVKSNPPDSHAPLSVWKVVRTGLPDLHHSVTEEELAASARSPEHHALMRRVGMKSFLLAPIRIRDRVGGVLSIVSATSHRRFDDNDVALVQELGRRVGTALENAKLYASAQQAAEAAARAARTAEDANRIKDEFLATVSHELRTPLNAIVGWAAMLRSRPVDPGVGKALEIIDRNAKAQVKIIDDILDVSRIITGKLRLELQATDFVAVAREALEVVRPSALAKRITLELAAPEPFTIVGDPERLQQVIWNLLSNAVKFTPVGGTIRVAIEKERSAATLVVSDNGQGIDPEFLPYVFERFKQADASTTRRYGGLGLGLALVRHLVELHGGSVAVESTVGKGSTFTITLPVRAVIPPVEPGAAPVAENVPNERAAAGALSGLRIVVVDDDTDARELLTTLLAQAGAVVEAASSVAAGFALIQQFRPDLLVSDIGMPEEDGYSLMRRVRMLSPEEGGSIPAIALTAYTRIEDRRKALAAGFTAHVGKPVSPEALVFAVKNAARPS